MWDPQYRHYQLYLVPKGENSETMWVSATRLTETKLRWVWAVDFCIVVSVSLVTQSCPTLRPHEPQHTRPPLSITNYRSPPKPMSIESVMPSNHLILCCPPLLPPSICPIIRVFSNELALCFRWRKYWSFSFSISPSNEYSGLISFTIDLLDLLAVQRTLKSLL